MLLKTLSVCCNRNGEVPNFKELGAEQVVRLLRAADHLFHIILEFYLGYWSFPSETEATPGVVFGSVPVRFAYV